MLGSFDDVPCGLAVASSNDDGRGATVVLRCCFVEAELREMGVGGRLLDLVDEFCDGRAGTRLQVLLPPGARAAKIFFEARGFVTTLLVAERITRRPTR